MIYVYTQHNKLTKGKSGLFHALQCTVMRFQQFQSTWNKNLPNLNSQDQTVAHIKADITS